MVIWAGAFAVSGVLAYVGLNGWVKAVMTSSIAVDAIRWRHAVRDGKLQTPRIITTKGKV
jgi:hypothetical protein